MATCLTPMSGWYHTNVLRAAQALRCLLKARQYSFLEPTRARQARMKATLRPVPRMGLLYQQGVLASPWELV